MTAEGTALPRGSRYQCQWAGQRAVSSGITSACRGVCCACSLRGLALMPQGAAAPYTQQLMQNCLAVWVCPFVAHFSEGKKNERIIAYYLVITHC